MKNSKKKVEIFYLNTHHLLPTLGKNFDQGFAGRRPGKAWWKSLATLTQEH